jgi:5-formyltetrahydrofolate cyclo-ligase
VDIAEAKKKFRVGAMERRRAAFNAAGDHAAERLSQNVLNAGVIKSGDVVSGFWPMGDEINLVPLLTTLSKKGFVCVLPVMKQRGAPLTFREWHPGAEMHHASFGVQEPPETAREQRPTVVLTPLLAFDAEGFRIGYGGGYYDRTLAELRAAGPVTVVGVGYEAQGVTELPHDRFDQPLDWIVTEVGARKFDRAANPAESLS